MTVTGCVLIRKFHRPMVDAEKLRPKAASYFDQAPKNYQPERHVGLSASSVNRRIKYREFDEKLRHFSPRNPT